MALPERRVSTRGRPPGYHRILLEPTCDTWHKDPLVDPIRPENNIGLNHIKHYTESCFKRIIENKNIDNIIPTLEQTKEWVRDYITEAITDPVQKDILLKDYYNDTFIEQMFKEMYETNEIPRQEQMIFPPKKLKETKETKKSIKTTEVIIHPKFSKIEEILKKKKGYLPYINKLKLSLSSYGSPVYQHVIIESTNLILKVWNKLHLVIQKANKIDYILFIYILNYLMKTIMVIETSKTLLTPRQLDIINLYIQSLQASYPEQSSYILQREKDYISVFIVMLNEYINYRKVTGYDLEIQKMRPLNEDELIIFFKKLKEKIIVLIGLEDFFDKPTEQVKLLKALNEMDIPYRELYQYLWLFITEKVKYSKEAMDFQNYNEGYCEDLLVNTHSFYNDITKQMKNECSMLITKQCTELTTLREETFKILKSEHYVKYTPETAWQDPNESYIRFHDVNRQFALIEFFKLWYQYRLLHGVTFWLKYIDVMYKGEEGFFTGVQQDLFQTCMDQLHPDNMNVFIPTEENGNRYQINRNFNFPDIYVDKLKEFLPFDETNQATKKTKAIFMEFLGGLFSCALLMGIEIPVKLSYFTLGYLYSNELTMDEYGLYFLMDIPSKAKPLYQLLKEDPDMIEYIGLEFNDQYPLISMDDPNKKLDESQLLVTKNNILNYIKQTGLYVLTTININDPPSIDLTMKKTYKAKREYYMTLLKSFKKGFFINVRGIFSVNMITVNILDTLLNRGGVNINNLKALINNYKVIPVYSEKNGTPERSIEIIQQKKIFTWFYNLLKNPDSDIPYGKYIKDADKLSTEEKHNLYYNNFIPQLLYFWTSSRSINVNEEHQVHFKLNDPRDQESINNKINALNDQIKAHTCFRYIDLPTYNIELPEFSEDTPDEKRNWRSLVSSMDTTTFNNFIKNHIDSGWKGWEQKIMDKLMLAIYETSGFGMAGGNTMNNIRVNKEIKDIQKCLKYVEKRCSIEKDYNSAFLCGFIYTVKCNKKLSNKQKQKLIEYAKNNTINFKNSTKLQLEKWGYKMIKASS